MGCNYYICIKIGLIIDKAVKEESNTVNYKWKKI